MKYYIYNTNNKSYLLSCNLGGWTKNKEEAAKIEKEIAMKYILNDSRLAMLKTNTTCLNNINVVDPVFVKSNKPGKNNVKLIKKVVKMTPAYKAGGIVMKVYWDSVVLSSNGKDDFSAVGIFTTLGIFKVVISSDSNGKVIVIIK